jgi:hypothetical protein
MSQRSLFLVLSLKGRKAHGCDAMAEHDDDEGWLVMQRQQHDVQRSDLGVSSA